MLKHTKTCVFISVKAEQALAEDIRQRHDIEACGLLLGHVDCDGSWHIERARPLRNIHNSPAYFEFAPEDLLEAELDHPGEIVGVYHSHPTGLRVASSTDRDNMRRVNVEQEIPWVWLIISGPFRPDSTYEQGQLSVVAYHHYHEPGLRQLPIELEGLKGSHS
jgi:proteasome lid subunit RPN8/RPN11